MRFEVVNVLFFSHRFTNLVILVFFFFGAGGGPDLVNL